jgi:lipopolysaccharide assembly LptE-like protein
MNRRFLSVLPFMALALTSCGYHVGGKADLVPKSIQTIAIPAFSSPSTRYQLSDLLTNEIGREFRARTRFRIVSNPAQADAVLNGIVTAVYTYPAVSDPTSGKSTSVGVTTTLNLRLVERATGRVLYSNPAFNVKSYYAIATDPHQVFNESGPAFRRLSEEAARDIVSAVVENF